MQYTRASSKDKQALKALIYRVQHAPNMLSFKTSFRKVQKLKMDF